MTLRGLIVLTPARLCAFVLLLGPALPASAQSTYYVNAAASGAEDGTSWNGAFPTLQDALSLVRSGDEIFIAAGTYYPDEGTGQSDGDRDAGFTLVSGVQVYGGFRAGCTDADADCDEAAAADPPTNVVTLSGDLSQDDGADFANNDDNAYSVVTATDCDASTLLDGVTITAGNADAASIDAQGAGGGLFAETSSPTLTDVTVTGNIAEQGGGLYAAGLGAGMQTLTVTSTTLSSNTATIQGRAIQTDGPLLITGSNSIIR